MEAKLYSIPAHEDAALDRSRIQLLRQSLGDQRCREIVSEAVFHLTDRLGVLQTALAEGDQASAKTFATRLAGLAEQVGLSDFSRVARDLAQCLASDDGNATAAVSARLKRLGEDSLLSVLIYSEQPDL